MTKYDDLREELRILRQAEPILRIVLQSCNGEMMLEQAIGDLLGEYKEFQLRKEHENDADL